VKCLLWSVALYAAETCTLTVLNSLQPLTNGHAAVRKQSVAVV